MFVILNINSIHFCAEKTVPKNIQEVIIVILSSESSGVIMARWSGILILCLLSFSEFKCELQDDNFIRKTPADGKVIIEKDDGKVWF